MDKICFALGLYGIRYDLLKGTRDIWLRDFMPVERKDGKYISFRYEPSYLNGYPHRKTDFKRDISGQFKIFAPEFHRVMYSNINLSHSAYPLDERIDPRYTG